MGTPEIGSVVQHKPSAKTHWYAGPSTRGRYREMGFHATACAGVKHKRLTPVEAEEPTCGLCLRIGRPRETE